MSEADAFAPALAAKLAPKLATVPFPGAPATEEFTEWVFFAPADGRIWFDKQRTLLLHANAFGSMRSGILEALGPARGREVLARVGYAQGKRDAELVRDRWQQRDASPQWTAGPRLHMLEGFVRVTPLRIDALSGGGFQGEYLWADSVEADEHLTSFGPSREPVCWTLAAYASGYASTLYGFPMECREVECRAAGHEHCRAVTKPAREWEREDRAAGRAPANAARSHAPAAFPASAGVRSIIGVSAPLVGARRMLEQVAATEATVLLRGESGVGKELFANALHGHSRRKAKPFVAVNCAAIPETLVEAELFGVERGAFTGATASRAGRFERADGGTLFLDEVGLMSMTAQAKLLRVLQEREIERVGGTRSRRIDVRIVAATNVDLWQEVEANRFRRDLFFRLNVFPIDLPPLRARRDDIPLLVDHFASVYAKLHGKTVTGLTNAAREALLNYDYPGNVRELQNLIERGVICAEEGGPIDRGDMFRQGELLSRATFVLGNEGRLHAAGGPMPGVDSSRQAGRSLPELERTLCIETLRACDGNVARAARKLGITRPTLDYRLRKWGLTGSARTSAALLAE